MQAQIAPAKVANAKPAQAKREVAVVLYGRDSKNKGHAAGFSATDLELALKAAALMGVRVWRVPAAGQSLALKVPKGKLFGSGRAFTPLVSAKLMAELELAGGPAPKPGKSATPATNAAHAGPSKATGGENGAPGGTPGGAASKAANDSLKRPSDWGAIDVGCEVLATTPGRADGWFESEVVTKRDTDLFELRWMDFPSEPLFVRRRDNLALLPPKPIG